MSPIILDTSIIITCYLLGSLSSAIIVCKIFRLPSPLDSGSNNPGATNVLRIGGKFPALITLVGDFLKSFVPIIILKILNFSEGLIALSGMAAFIGHLYPIFFRFNGGKGVATSFGVYFALDPLFGIAITTYWLIAAKTTKISSLGALCASFLAPISYYFYQPSRVSTTIVLAVMTIFIYFRHIENIKRLISGRENKI